MKSKANLKQLMILILLTCVSLINCEAQNIKKDKKSAHNELLSNVSLWSDYVDSTLAVSYINNYKASPLQTIDDDGNLVPLYQFSFDAYLLKEILDNNANRKRQGKVEQIAFYFGHEYVNNNNSNIRWHLLAYGMVHPLSVPITGGTILDVSSISQRDASIFDDALLSVRIKKKPAETSRSNYRNNLTTNTPLQTILSLNGIPLELDGFSFTAENIREIIEYNASGESTPDKIILKLGLEYLDPPINKQKKWHIVAYGMKNGNYLIPLLPELLLPFSIKQTHVNHALP